MPSQPYDPPPEAPKGWTLQEALAFTTSADGHVHCGKLDFASKKDYLDFRAAQFDLGGTKMQLATLHQLETTGVNPGAQTIKAAPAGTTVDGLLDLHGQKPDEKGLLHLGKLRVPAEEYAKFAELQKHICTNPEALAALYHLENGKDPVVFRVASSDMQDRQDPSTRTIVWNPKTAKRDATTGNTVDPGSAALHEETHQLIFDNLGPTLRTVPDAKFANFDDRGVIEGPESRNMARLGHAPRESHLGSLVPVNGLDSQTPSLTVRQDGKERQMAAPFKQSGRVMGISEDGWVKLAVRGDGSGPGQSMELRVEEVQAAFDGSVPGARVLLNGARTHNETVTLATTNDGRVIYDNPAQQQRLHDHPQPWPPFPTPMPQPGKEAAAPVRAPEPAGMTR